MNEVRISLIVAVSENGVIGKDGGIPWRLSSDLKHFRRITFGKPVVMGRKTYASLGKPLDYRDNIVITRNPDKFRDEHGDVVDVASSLEEALRIAGQRARERWVEEVMVIGGAEIYEAALEHAGRIYLTRVHAEVDGDTYFVTLDPAAWRVSLSKRHKAGNRDDHDFTFSVLERL